MPSLAKRSARPTFSLLLKSVDGHRSVNGLIAETRSIQIKWRLTGKLTLRPQASTGTLYADKEDEKENFFSFCLFSMDREVILEAA